MVTHLELVQENITMAMAADPQKQIQKMQKSKHLWNLSTLKNDDPFRTGNRKDLRWLWPKTQKTDSEDAELQICMKPMDTE